MTATTSPVAVREVADAFGLGTNLSQFVAVARGAMGTVFRVTTETGTYAAKQLFWGPTGAEAANVAFQFAAADAGVRLARPVLARRGDVVVEVGPDDWWRVYEWAAGSHCDAQPAPVDVVADLGEQLGRLHALRYDAGPTIDEWYRQALGADRIHAALDTAGRHGFDVEHRRADLVDLDGIVAAASPGEPVGCHHDLGRSNIVVAGHGCTLLDWDNAGAGDAAREFASALILWAEDPHREADPSLVTAMVDAYRGAGGVFAPHDLTVFAQRCSAWVHYVVMCCEHLDDSDMNEDHAAFERAAIHALAREDQSVGRLARFLAAVPGE